MDFLFCFVCCLFWIQLNFQWIRWPKFLNTRGPDGIFQSYSWRLELRACSFLVSSFSAFSRHACTLYHFYGKHPTSLQTHGPVIVMTMSESTPGYIPCACLGENKVLMSSPHLVIAWTYSWTWRNQTEMSYYFKSTYRLEESIHHSMIMNYSINKSV